jgi:uncharacterized protein (DUF488 family)
VLRGIFLQHHPTPAAQLELEALVELVRGVRRVCLLCYEADPAHCHRSLVADALKSLVPLEIRHLTPHDERE